MRSDLSKLELRHTKAAKKKRIITKWKNRRARAQKRFTKSAYPILKKHFGPMFEEINESPLLMFVKSKIDKKKLIPEEPK